MSIATITIFQIPFCAGGKTQSQAHTVVKASGAMLSFLLILISQYPLKDDNKAWFTLCRVIAGMGISAVPTPATTPSQNALVFKDTGGCHSLAFIKAPHTSQPAVQLRVQEPQGNYTIQKLHAISQTLFFQNSALNFFLLENQAGQLIQINGPPCSRKCSPHTYTDISRNKSMTGVVIRPYVRDVYVREAGASFSSG